jgi:hypothetical protein
MATVDGFMRQNERFTVFMSFLRPDQKANRAFTCLWLFDKARTGDIEVRDSKAKADTYMPL